MKTVIFATASPGTLPPYFLRELERVGGLDPAVKSRVPIVVIAESTLDFTLP